jgi:hypothetical protein
MSAWDKECLTGKILHGAGRLMVPGNRILRIFEMS